MKPDRRSAASGSRGGAQGRFRGPGGGFVWFSRI